MMATLVSGMDSEDNASREDPIDMAENRTVLVRTATTAGGGTMTCLIWSGTT